MESLAGRVIAVAGAGGNLGPTVVGRLASSGAVLALGGRDEAPLATLTENLSDRGGHSVGRPARRRLGACVGAFDRRAPWASGRARTPRRRLARWTTHRRGAPRGLGLSPWPARPHRPERYPGVRLASPCQRSRALHDGLERASSGADTYECRLRGGEGGRRDMDARARGPVSRLGSDRERHRRRRDSDAGDAGRVAGQGLLRPSRPRSRSPRRSTTSARMLRPR